MKRLFENVYEKEVFNCCDKLVSINEKCISSSNLSKKVPMCHFHDEYRISIIKKKLLIFVMNKKKHR